MKQPIQPGQLWAAHQGGHKGLANRMMKRMKASGPIKMSGSFHGKSNTLGHGGRAAQLKAHGVPGGVIGNLARAAHAAPGQANFHGKKKRKATKKKQAPHLATTPHFMKRKKAPMPDKQELGMAFKKKRKTGFEPKEGDKEEKRKRKGARESTDGQEGAEGEKEMKRKHRKGDTCMKCKGAHATHEHGKHAKKKSASK